MESPSEDSWEDIATSSLTFDEQGNRKEPRTPEEPAEEGEPQRIKFDRAEAEKILDPENPPPITRLPRVVYRPLTEAKPELWEYYIYLCRASSEQHARCYLVLQGWDADENYSYFKELREQKLNDEVLHTTHLPPNNGSEAVNDNQSELELG